MHIHSPTRAHAYIHIYEHIHICINIDTHIHMHVYMHVHVKHICVRIHVQFVSKQSPLLFDC